MITVYDSAYEKHEYPDATGWSCNADGTIDVFAGTTRTRTRKLLWIEVVTGTEERRYLATFASEGWTYVERS